MKKKGRMSGKTEGKVRDDGKEGKMRSGEEKSHQPHKRARAMGVRHKRQSGFI